VYSEAEYGFHHLKRDTIPKPDEKQRSMSGFFYHQMWNRLHDLIASSKTLPGDLPQ
jgi:hypothetical protein